VLEAYAYAYAQAAQGILHELGAKHPPEHSPLHAPEGSIKEGGLSGPGGMLPRLQQVLLGQEPGFLLLANQGRNHIAQHPFPACDQKIGAAEAAMDDLGFL
jgi:hypothetical protein